MLDFKSLNLIKQDINTRDQIRNSSYETSYHEALTCFKAFGKDQEYNKNHLKQATIKLLEALEHKRSGAEPYICLSCIFYMLNETKLCLKYLKIAESLNPKHPQLEELKALLAVKRNIPVLVKTSSELTKAPEENIIEKPRKASRIRSLKKL